MMSAQMARVIIVCGSPGAGKTTYGKKLAARTGAVFLDIDTATERLVRLALRESGRDPDDRDSPDFKRTCRGPIYEQLFDIARENLPFNRVVIAGPFTREIRDAQWPRKLFHRLGAAVEIHYVFCPPEERRERLLQRANARDRTKLEDWDSYIQYYGGEEPPCFNHVVVDGTDRTL